MNKITNWLREKLARQKAQRDVNKMLAPRIKDGELLLKGAYMDAMKQRYNYWINRLESEGV